MEQMHTNDRGNELCVFHFKEAYGLKIGYLGVRTGREREQIFIPRFHDDK